MKFKILNEYKFRWLNESLIRMRLPILIGSPIWTKSKSLKKITQEKCQSRDKITSPLRSEDKISFESLSSFKLVFRSRSEFGGGLPRSTEKFVEHV